MTKYVVENLDTNKQEMFLTEKEALKNYREIVEEFPDNHIIVEKRTPNYKTSTVEKVIIESTL